MSSIAIAGDTSGLVTIQAPAVAGTVVLTTPTASGTLLTTGSLIPIANGGTGSTSITFANLTTNVTGILPVANGGTNLTAVGTSGNVLTSNGTTWVSSTPAVGGATLVRSARTSNTILGTADNSTLIDITSGTFSQTFTAAATLGSGWFCYIRNAGTGDITLDPNNSELIDGLTSYIMYPSEVRLIQCTGTAFFSVVLTSFYKVFTASGTFTKPPGYQVFEGILWGGGGAGGSSTNMGFGGGGGAAVPFALLASNIGASLGMTIGSGGTATGQLGNTGGTSTLGSLFSAFGGGGGGTNEMASYYPGGGGGAFSAGVATLPNAGAPTGSGFGGGGTTRVKSVYGGGGGGPGGIASSPGGSSIYGGGGGGTKADNVTSNLGGVSTFGGSGGASKSGDYPDATPAQAGTAPGGGGGGGGGIWEAATGGDGARGELRIWGIV